MTPVHFKKFPEVLARRRVLVVGDAILDVAYVGRALGPSVEDPAVTTYANERVVYSYGGASLVARNLLALGAAADYVTVLGDDANLEKCRAFSYPRLRFNTKVIESGRVNTVKERFWAGSTLVFKWDFRDDRDISAGAQRKMLSAVRQRLRGTSALVIADNRHGVLAGAVIPQLLAAAKRAKVPVYVDSQVTAARPSNHQSYRGADVICLNLKEAQAVSPAFQPERAEQGLREITKNLGATTVVVKLGEQGSVALANGEFIRTPAFRVSAMDAVGAGDAFIAALAAAHGTPWVQALEFANRWAALSTTVRGPNPPTLEAFRQSLAD
ncbi:MAG: PfkB family carbohydrate kinase [bacterium]|nr:PfkB family carbohydrate kinase [bacterium]